MFGMGKKFETVHNRIDTLSSELHDQGWDVRELKSELSRVSYSLKQLQNKVEDAKKPLPEVLKGTKEFTVEDQLQAAYDVIGDLQAELAGIKAAWLKQDLEAYYKDNPKPEDTFMTQQFQREKKLAESTKARQPASTSTKSNYDRQRNDRDDTSFVSTVWNSSIYDSSPSSYSSSSSCSSSSYSSDSSSSCDSGSSSCGCD